MTYLEIIEASIGEGSCACPCHKEEWLCPECCTGIQSSHINWLLTRGKELEAENKKLKSLLGMAMTGLDWWEKSHPEDHSENDEEFKQMVFEATSLNPGD